MLLQHSYLFQVSFIRLLLISNAIILLFIYPFLVFCVHQALNRAKPDSEKAKKSAQSRSFKRLVRNEKINLTSLTYLNDNSWPNLASHVPYFRASRTHGGKLDYQSLDHLVEMGEVLVALEIPKTQALALFKLGGLLQRHLGQVRASFPPPIWLNQMYSVRCFCLVFW